MSKLILEANSCPGTKEVTVIKNGKVFKRKKQVLYCEITIDINTLKSLDENVTKDMLYQHFKKHFKDMIK